LKKNIYLRIAALLLIGSLFGLCTVPGTLSRYVERLPGYDEQILRAGLFHVEVNGEVLGVVAEIEVDLFETLKHTGNARNNHDNPNYSAWINEENEYVLLSAEVIAPGTGGMIPITVQNFSEVDVEIVIIEGDYDDDGVPIEWWDGAAWTSTFPGIPTGLDTELAALDGDGELEIELWWRWIFNGDDVLDTGLGIAAAAGNPATPSIGLKVVALQILPS